MLLLAAEEVEEEGYVLEEWLLDIALVDDEDVDSLLPLERMDFGPVWRRMDARGV